MEQEQNKKRRRKKLRQEWNPHWLLKLAYTGLSVAVSAAKIAVGAAVTVLLIVLICGVVFVGTLGDYLQEDILTEAGNWSIDDYGLEETSFIYYTDENGKTAEERFFYENGISDYIKEIVGESANTDPVLWHLETRGRDRDDLKDYNLQADISFCVSSSCSHTNSIKGFASPVI